MAIDVKGNLVNWSATGTPTAAGQLGMDKTTGVPYAFVGGAATPLLSSANVALWVPVVAGQYDTVQTVATPLVIGSAYLNPATFTGWTGCDFEAVGFVSNAAATGTAALWNVTDNALIASVSFTATTSAFASASAASLASLVSAKIVEVRLYVSSASYSASVTMARLRFF